MRFLRLPLAAGLLACCALGAGAETLRVRYSVSLIGLPLGTAHLNGSFSPSAYSIEAGAKLTGVATLVTRSGGAATASGAIAGGRIVPAAYATTASNSETTRTVRMSMTGRAVRGVDISPPFEEKPGRVPLTDANRRDIVDPLSAAVMVVPGVEPVVGPAACNRKLPVFDGYTRFDVTLSFVGLRQVAIPGYSGPVAVCAARFTPIAGHRPARETIKYMTSNRHMEAWLAPVGGQRVLVPFRISVKTRVGTTLIEAREFSVEGAPRAAAAPK